MELCHMWCFVYSIVDESSTFDFYCVYHWQYTANRKKEVNGAVDT